jgi:hypothetical protein
MGSSATPGSKTSLFLQPPTTITANGQSEAVDVSPLQGRPLLLRLGITRVVEQESLEVAIYGSADGETWSAAPLASFPQKFYEGTSQLVLDLSSAADVRYLRAQWKANRWGRGDLTPSFDFYVGAEELAVRLPEAKAPATPEPPAAPTAG